MKKSLIHALIVVLVTCGAFVLDHSTAQAAKPRVTIAIARPSINAGQRPVVKYTIMKSGKKSKFYLQRRVGTRGVWRNVVRMHSRSGRVAAPAVPLGIHLYRVVAISKRKHHNKVVTASPVRGVHAFGNVSLTTFCSAVQWTYQCTQNAADGVLAVGSRSFSYQFTLPTLTSPDFASFSLKASSCRRITMNFADLYQGQEMSATIRILQQTRDAVQRSTPAGKLGRFSAALDGRPSVLQFQSTPSQTAASRNIAVSGVASCYTSNAKRS